MKRLISFAIAAAVIVSVISGYSSVVLATDIQPGVDLFTTPAGGATHVDLSSNPIPPGFFGPGSDPFAGDVVLHGVPLNTTPPGILGPTDTIVRRGTPATLPQCPSTDVVPIEIVALSLVSAEPIIVTYNGGQNQEFWDVSVCLSEVAPQQPGSMTVIHGGHDGGTFSSILPVTCKFTFVRIRDGEVRVLDFGAMPQSIPFETQNGHWLHFDPGFSIITSPGMLTVDDDCNVLTPEVPVEPSSNFFPGVRALPSNCDAPGSAHRARMTLELYLPFASHGVLPAQPPGQPDGDGDFIPDDKDNCPNIENCLQLDLDDDAVGDVCDNCPHDYNPFQEDSDGDGIGDACEAGGGCSFVPGDINGNGSANGIDVTYGVSYLKGGSAPKDSCDCPPLAFPFYAAMDVNGNCAANGIDITYFVSYLKGQQPSLLYCQDCPPAGLASSPGPAVMPIKSPTLKSRGMLRQGE